MQRNSQNRKRSKNLGVIPLDQGKPTKVKLEYRWYRINDNHRWLRVEYNPVSGKIRSPYGIWQLPKEGAKLVKVKPSSQSTTGGSSQATVKPSGKLEIPKPEIEGTKTDFKALLEQKALERQLKEIEKHNLYINRQYGR